MPRALSTDELDRVCVVLVRARNPANIGSIARAMHDFGFRRLRVVNEFAVPFEAARSAVDASEVLAGALAYASVAKAVADCTLVLGTTAVGERTLRLPLCTLADAAEPIRAELSRGSAGRVAILFGSEKTGLSNEELSHCHWTLTIPMAEHAGVRHPSMNLGQAVAVCLYELVRGDAASDEPVTGRSEPATAELNERLAALLHQVLSSAEYTRHHPANSSLDEVRRIVLRMGLDSPGAAVWLGMLRQILWKLHQGAREP